MNNFASLFWTTVGRKLFTGLTGLLLVGFVIGHLAGNLTLFMGPRAMNDYAFFLETAAHGMFLPVAEIALILMFGVHVVTALAATSQNRGARSHGYAAARDAGGRSRKTLSSKTMAITGVVLLVFVLIHVAQFRLGLFGTPASFYPAPDGEHRIRDLYRMVVETFRNPVWVGLYLGVMVLLGLHLRHGVWSAFQTLGLMSPRLRTFLYTAAIVIALGLAVGFLLLPLYSHFALSQAQFMTTGAGAPGGAQP